jgi:hypothetical protein
VPGESVGAKAGTKGARFKGADAATQVRGRGHGGSVVLLAPRDKERAARCHAVSKAHTEM